MSRREASRAIYGRSNQHDAIPSILRASLGTYG